MWILFVIIAVTSDGFRGTIQQDNLTQSECNQLRDAFNQNNAETKAVCVLNKKAIIEEKK